MKKPEKKEFDYVMPSLLLGVLVVLLIYTTLVGIRILGG
jgi:hypothetical protein